ncbi:hypothetical protein O0L34_g11453 [Tuta absoluta]|nr:hypothetical protein O0L34_g11453 [Tuta absoluta]
MFNPELYRKNSLAPTRDALESLKKFTPKWREHCRVLDLGCGDGFITSEVLRPCLPPGFGQLVGSDIGPRMVAYANAKYGDDRCKFIELDMTGDVPKDMVASFDHVFSSYAIHWVHEQKKTFSNIYSLLVKGGSCLLIFQASSITFNICRILARQPKWQLSLQDIERYISPYQDMQEPKTEVNRIMASVGFKNIHVELQKKTCRYEEENYKNTMLAIFPIKLPSELIQDFMVDYMLAAGQLNMIEMVEGRAIITVDYKLLKAMGTKS